MRKFKKSVKLQEVREYFSELVKPLATNEILEDMFKKLIEEIREI